MNHSSSAATSVTTTGLISKARDILAAIRTLKTVEREARPATVEEITALRKFAGFGAVALSIFPHAITGEYKPGWKHIGEELKSLLTPEEYNSALRTIFTQYFTSPIVMKSMHDALARLGVPGNAVVLEPGAGIGNFMSASPRPYRFIGVELDGISGRIARVLHPKADIRIEDFADTKLPPLDAVIGNVPFADVKLKFNGQKLSLHDFCVAKSLDALKPGGVLAVVTSHYTLDKQNASVREMISKQADFLGAIRLPSDAFKAEGTTVVTDILFLRKREPGKEPDDAAPWIQSRPFPIDGAVLPISGYFLDNPDMVLGKWSREDTLYAEGYSVKSNGDLATQLRHAVERLPRFERTRVEAQNANLDTHKRGNETHKPEARNTEPAFIPPPPLRHVTESSFFVTDRVIYQLANGESVPVVYGGTKLSSNGTMTGKRLGSLIELRDLSRRVLQSQNEGWPEKNRNDARRDLNWAYDRFVSLYGPINKTTISEPKEDGSVIRRMPNIVKFREDPDAMLVMSLEEYDETTNTAKKAAIMKRDVVGPKPPITSVASAEEGLLVSLDHKGCIDLPYIAGLYGHPETAIISELGDLIYRDPESKEWQTADAYLSGNVREKLAIAEQAGPEYSRNADALREVQPEDVLPGDIDANLGAPWIPERNIRQFAEHLFGGSFTVAHLKKDAVWSLDPDYRALTSVASTTDYGTGRISGTALLELALNMKQPAIYDTIKGANGDERVLNPVETLAAKEKQKLIKDRFKNWIFADPDRTEQLVRLYNDTYNNLRPRLFDGSHLEFPGMSQAITLRQHQVDAVWRSMTGGNTLLAHVVGGGKSGCMISSGMKMRQTGLIKKPIFVVPNHMLEQFAREFMQWYPNAKILTASKEDFTKERRKLLTAKIATGDWDGIIVTHSSFERIGMSSEFQRQFLQQQIDEYNELLRDSANASGKSRNIIKSMEKQKARFQEKLKDLLAEDKKDSGLVFDELGIDQMFIDECLTYDTLIETDEGLLKIGDIVSERRQVNVKTLNHHTGMVEWKPVVNWFANPRRAKLVEVYHEKGSICCTTSHMLFAGLVSYRKAGTIKTGETLLVLQNAFSPEQQMFGKNMAEVLLTGVSDQGQNHYRNLRDLRSGVLLSHTGRSQPGQAPASVLQREMQDARSACRSHLRSQVAKDDETILGCPYDVVERQAITLQGKEKTRIGRENERQAAVSRNQRKGISRPQSNRPQTVSAPRQRTSICPSDSIGREDRDGDRACDQHAPNPAHDAKNPQSLQSRSRRPGEDAGSRIGRVQPQFTEGQGEGREEGQGLVASRVVSVTVLEPGRDGEYRFGGRTHNVVYDIEVADNHNYFANGILVHNCQAYKNLSTPTKMDRVAGIQTGGSERAFDLFMKSRYMEKHHPGHGLIGASGTPISNSMVEMYTMQRYFDPEGLRSRGIEHFDAWAATFGEVVDAMEISPDGASLRPRSRFAKFVNLPELVQMFRAFSDVQTADMLNLPTPKLEGGKAQTIACPMSDEQFETQQELVRRYDRIRNEKVDPREDNALKVTTDGRKLALDARMLSPNAPDFPDSKINMLVGNVERIWNRTASTRGTQLIFCDMGVRPTPWGFSAYDDIIGKFVHRGIPRHQIAVIGDADTDAKKQVLFEKVRQGIVRVLIGSTQKMGMGTNVQKRLAALHHLDAPWKPAEVEQREGRILRQGNDNEEVSIYRYVTERSFDAYMWQALETKARFIAQVMSGDCAVRKAEDVGGQELSYAEVKAIASGNPAVLTLAETDAELQRLAILKKNHADEQYLARCAKRDLPGAIERHKARIASLTADMATASQSDVITVGTKIPDDLMENLAAKLEMIPSQVSENRRFKLGMYHGLEYGVTRHPLGMIDAYIEGEIFKRTQLRDNPGPRAVMNAVERLVNGLEDDRQHTVRELEVAEGQLRDYESRSGKVFAHAEYMSKLADLRDKLRTGLSETPPEGAMPVGEIAAKIKELREANTVEAAPERLGARKAARAEQPVTARIRARRVAEREVVEEPEGEIPTVDLPPVAVAEPEKPAAQVIPMPDFRQRVAEGRDVQLRLF